MKLIDRFFKKALNEACVEACVPSEDRELLVAVATGMLEPETDPATLEELSPQGYVEAASPEHDPAVTARIQARIADREDYRKTLVERRDSYKRKIEDVDEQIKTLRGGL